MCGYNYKGPFSIVLMAIAGPNYTFEAFDAGYCGRQSDADIFGISSMGNALLSGSFGIPNDDCPVGTNDMCPHCLAGDEAFLLRKYLLRPYSRIGLDHEKGFQLLIKQGS